MEGIALEVERMESQMKDIALQRLAVESVPSQVKWVASEVKGVGSDEQ